MRSSALPLSRLALQVDALQKEVRSVKRALGDSDIAAQEKAAALSASNAALTKDVSDLRGRQGPLLAEVESVRTQLAKMAADLEDARRGKAEALSRLEKAATAAANQDALLRELKNGESRLLRALEDEQAKVASLQQAAARDSEILALKDGEVLAAQQKAVDCNNEVRRLADEGTLLRRELDSLG